MGIPDANRNPGLVFLNRDIGGEDDFSELFGQFVVNECQHEVVKGLSVVDRPSHFEQGGKGEHFPGFRNFIEVIMERLELFHTVTGEPILRPAFFGFDFFFEFAEILELLTFFFVSIRVCLFLGNFLGFLVIFKIEDDVEGGGSSQFLVNDLEPLVNFSGFLEVVDETVFHHQPGPADNTDDQQQGAEPEDPVSITVGETREDQGQGEPVLEGKVRHQLVEL